MCEARWDGLLFVSYSFFLSFLRRIVPLGLYQTLTETPMWEKVRNTWRKSLRLCPV